MAAGTFMVRGHRVRSQSQRRYVVVAIAPGWVRIVRRSDVLATARRHAAREGGRDTFAVVIDTTTGEEV